VSSTRPVSVALVAEQLRREPPGGIGTYALGLLGGLRQLPEPERPAVTLLASRPDGPTDPLSELGFPVRSSKLPAAVLDRCWGAGLLRVASGDVVHAISLLAPVPTGRRPLVATVHDIAWRSMPAAYPAHGRRWHEQALRRAARRCAAIIVPSQATADALTGAGVGIGTDRIVVVPHGADHMPEPDDVATAAVLQGLRVSGPYLLSVGTLEPRKNLVRLFEAYRAVRSELPEPWPLVVVGPTGWGDDPAGRNRAPSEGIVFAGRVTDQVLVGLYRRARCLAYVPMLEGFGLPVAEAMAQGIPVVASPVPSSGGAALEVDPTDAAAIAEALAIAATDGPERDALVERGRRRASTLRWVDTARAHVDLWRRLASGSRP
jgi:glycosyltransferase involved in cell wall biosynthesis